MKLLVLVKCGFYF